MENTDRDWLTEQEVFAFVGNNDGYYKDKWKSHPNTSYYKGWNGVAFFFFLEWAAYRKMYREAALAMAGIISISFVIAFLSYLIPFDTDFFGEIFGQGVKVAFSAFGNGFYRKKALRTMRQTKGMSESEQIRYLSQKGGTSIVGMIIFIIIEIALFLLPRIIFDFY